MLDADAAKVVKGATGDVFKGEIKFVSKKRGADDEIRNITCVAENASCKIDKTKPAA